MNYQQMAYLETMRNPVLVENPLMDPVMDGLIDPNLKPATSPPHLIGSWDRSQVLCYSGDNNRPTPLSYPMVDPAVAEATSRDGSAVFPPFGQLQRQESPSFSHSSSTSSSILSPPREGDYYHLQSPPTPTDTTVMSPILSHYESSSSRSQLCRFTGLADDCVKPYDIFQETPESYFDDTGNFGPDFPTRCYSISSDEGSAHLGMCGRPGKVGLSRSESSSGFPADVKEEIHISGQHGDFRTFESEDAFIPGDPRVLDLKNEDGDDDDYKPNQKQRRAKLSTERITRNRKRPCISQPPPDTKRSRIEPGDSATIDRPTTKPVIQGAKGSFSCTECSKKVLFKDESGLQNHMKKQHTRPFVCVFGFAGCSSTFASKNEWKRHCSSQHLVLHYWVCQQDQCSKVSSKSTMSTHGRSNHPCYQSTYSPALPRGTIFNRKDLYTQHLRRMHIPSALKKQVKQRKPAPEWEAAERWYQDKARRTRCDLPTHMQCPAAGCSARFDGANAWDDRMEHVAKHLEKAVTGSEPPIQFGGENDRTLMDWATRADIAIVEKGERGKWKLRNPLKSGSGTVVQTTKKEEDEDAEGEEVDE
ncbi:hypothetical protein GGS23DRAFT_334818 [Durotheca rogersii]|uniref:uncharacterized protein n=1 Tax=Durotheca rogersii TaxID=419775 RepID=UPI00221F7A6C|nr:uncharacterized protein GGS23DRAFT_334818 [Durotheca rogersii]KAI5858173.1 hypothetical protein GGS23DRAFT_334818 [Durotheca rogersii]